MAMAACCRKGEVKMIDNKALWPISAGVYLFTCVDADGERPIGRTVDAVSHVNVKPSIISVSLHNGGYTSHVVKPFGHFSLTVLAKDAPMELVKGFGLRSSKDVDKFEGHEVKHDENGSPWIADGALSQLSCEIKTITNYGDHLLLLAEVTDAQVLAQGEAMTYAYYRSLK